MSLATVSPQDRARCAPRPRDRAGRGAAPRAAETQIIAIYGKGGIGKSFTLANLSYMMAQQGKQRAADRLRPEERHDLAAVRRPRCPTIIETSSRKKLAGEPVAIGDVCFKRDGVFAMELGGPEVGRGCGGRGIIHGFELLEKLGFHDWGFDYVLLDFLGDVVCGGFGLPIARDMCQKVIVVGSNDLQSLYVANNVCSAVEYFRKLGGNVGVAGMVINKDDGTGEAQAFAEAVGIPVLASIPADEDIRRKSANYEIIGRPGGRWAPLFEELAQHVGRRPAGAPDAADARTRCSACSRARRSAAASCSSPPPSRTCAARPCSRSRPSKSSTTALSVDDARPSRQPPELPWRRETCAAQRRRQERDRWPALAADYPNAARTTSRSPCARPSARCASGLRMRRTATILSGSACCVYGLTFTSHFYGARRTVGYVPFNSEIARHRQAVRGHPRRGLQADRQAGRLRRHRRHQPLRPDRLRRAARPAAEGRSTACASSASTCRASACRRMRRPRTCWPAPCCAMRGWRPRPARSSGRARPAERATRRSR